MAAFLPPGLDPDEFLAHFEADRRGVLCSTPRQPFPSRVRVHKKMLGACFCCEFSEGFLDRLFLRHFFSSDEQREFFQVSISIHRSDMSCFLKLSIKCVYLRFFFGVEAVGSFGGQGKFEEKLCIFLFSLLLGVILIWFMERIQFGTQLHPTYWRSPNQPTFQ